MKPRNDGLIKTLLDSGRFVVTAEGHVLSNGKRVGHKSHKDKNDYRYVIYRSVVDGKKFQRSLLEHRIIWIALNGEIPDEFEVNHKDGIKDNNHPSNLELVTKSGNQKHAIDLGLAKIGRGDESRHRRYTFEFAEEVRTRVANGESIPQIAKQTKCPPSSIRNLAKGYSFKYAN